MLDEIADVMQPGTLRVHPDYFRTVDPFDTGQVWVYGAVLSLIPKPLIDPGALASQPGPQ
jgi:hypothetical protein